MKLTVALLLLALLAGSFVVYASRRRAGSKNGAPAAAAAVVDGLRRDVTALCAIGERNTFHPENLHRAADLVERELAAAGYRVERQSYQTSEDIRSDNLIVEIPGRSKEIVVIGAHYDSVLGTVGADDNASGVAALLALARRFAGTKPARTLRFVAFANEEPPHFQSANMGSYQYAKRCHERKEKIVAMISLETIGYYSDEPRSQHYPAPLAAMYPTVGNFIGFATNVGSRALLNRCVSAFKRGSKFPIESAALPEMVPGIGWSDQWSFWQFGWPAIMVTDTAPFRNPHYHEASDRPETLDYARLGQVVEGMAAVVEELTR
jgi:Zn-dependent M28 family amino/carboxypeptidase